MPRPFRSGLVLLLALAAWAGASAQPVPEPCEDVLAEAEQRYLEQDYGSVEPYVIECVYRPGVTERQLQAAYRLLALSYIRQDLLADAQLTIVKLFGVDYEYEPDPVNDPPFYVALVSAVKEQLRVEVEDVEREQRGGSAPPREPTASEPASARPEPVAYEPVAVASVEEESVAGATPPEEVIDINAASADQLESLSGIGPALAQRIIEYRTEYGAFARPEDLQNVRGIGPRTIESLLPFIAAGEEVASAGEDGPQTPAPVELPEAPASGRIDLNTATAAELDGLRGIGPALAQRIIDSRETEGPFRSVDDVTRVRGIGPAKLDGFRDQVTVGG